MFILFLFFFGLAVGSLLNAVIYRLQTDEAIIFERSHCVDCKTTLRWFDLIPLFSFFWLRTKCRYCGKKISWQYPAVELATALVFVWIYSWQYPHLASLSFGTAAPFLLDWQFISFLYYILAACLLIIIFVYDLKTYLILDKISYPAIVLSLLFLSLEAWHLQSFEFWRNGILAGLLAAGFFLSLVVMSKGKWMGIGDIKLALFMGFVLNWPQIIIALFLSFMVGAIVGIFLMLLKKKGLKSEIPFGPFLAGATLVTLIYSSYLTDLINSYMML